MKRIHDVNVDKNEDDENAKKGKYEITGADEFQLEAINSQAKYKLILAGPGSGKTFTLIHCIYKCAQENGGGFTPIMFTTFTKKASNEMIERLKTMAGRDANITCTYGTMHSICFRILKTAKIINDDVTILSSYNQKKIFKELLKSADMNTENDNIKAYIKKYDQISSTINESDDDIIIKYNEEKQKNNTIDFNDILKIFYIHLNEKNKLLIQCISKIKYIFFDEYQDINQIQYEIIKLMCDLLDSHLVAVGDHRQTIYTFRGSDNNIIYSFESDFKSLNRGDVKVCYLNNNYRSTDDIAKTCSKFIKDNNKMMDGESEMIGKGIHHTTTENIYYRSNNIYKLYDKMVNILKDGKFKLSEQVVLCRNKQPLRELGYQLFKNKIPYEESGNTILDKPEIKDFVAFMSFVVNPANMLDLSRILLLLPKIGEKTCKSIIEKISIIQLQQQSTKTTNMTNQQDENPLDWMVDETPTTVSLESVDRTKLTAIIIDILKSDKKTEGLAVELEKMWDTNNDGRLCILKLLLDFFIQDVFLKSAYTQKDPEEVKKMIRKFTTQLKTFIPSKNILQLQDLKDILFELNLFKESGTEYSDTGHIVQEKILLSTIHASKGMEFSRVLLLIPELLNYNDTEEENRIRFVAISRAKYEIVSFEKFSEENKIHDRQLYTWAGDIYCEKHTRVGGIKDTIPPRPLTCEIANCKELVTHKINNYFCYKHFSECTNNFVDYDQMKNQGCQFDLKCAFKGDPLSGYFRIEYLK